MVTLREKKEVVKVLSFTNKGKRVYTLLPMAHINHVEEGEYCEEYYIYNDVDNNKLSTQGEY